MRGPLRLLGAALAATAALVFLQTFVLRAVPYDASWAGSAATTVFRASFMIADAASIVALVGLGRRAPSVSPFSTLASVLIALGFLSGVVGFFVSGAIGGIEPMISFGATLLIAFTLAAVLGPTAAPDRRRDVLFAAALAVAVIVLGMRIVSAVSHDATSMILSWLRWAFAVAQPALLAALAFVLARSADGADRAPSDEHAAAARAGGSYRAAGEAAFAPPRPEHALPGPASIDPMRRASSGIEMHRAAFIMRVCVVGALLVMAVITGAELAAIFLPLFGAATAVVMALGITRQRALASFDSGPAMRSAQIAFIVTAVAEIAALAWVLGELALRRRAGAGALSFVVAAVASALGIFFVSRAHERAGELFFRLRLASLARWTQGMLVLAVTAMLATFAAVAHVGRRAGPNATGAVLAIGFALLMCVTLVAVVVIHVMTLNEANRALKDRLEMAQPPLEVKA